jgi:hypothetical protein
MLEVAWAMDSTGIVVMDGELDAYRDVICQRSPMHGAIGATIDDDEAVYLHAVWLQQVVVQGLRLARRRFDTRRRMTPVQMLLPPRCVVDGPDDTDMYRGDVAYVVTALFLYMLDKEIRTTLKPSLRDRLAAKYGMRGLPFPPQRNHADFFRTSPAEEVEHWSCVWSLDGSRPVPAHWAVDGKVKAPAYPSPSESSASDESAML